MNRTAGFGSPFLLGFEHLERLLERTAKSASDGYPPYNIEQTGQDVLRITLAVAHRDAHTNRAARESSAAPPQEHNSRPKSCRRSRGSNCAGCGEVFARS